MTDMYSRTAQNQAYGTCTCIIIPAYKYALFGTYAYICDVCIHGVQIKELLTHLYQRGDRSCH